MSRAQPWGDAHRREAKIGTRRLADEADIGGHPVRAQALTLIAASATGVNMATEAVWCERLRLVGVDAARVRREVARVRALAEGRKIREVKWRVGDGRIEYSEDVARSLLSSFEGPLVRVTRTRRP